MLRFLIRRTGYTILVLWGVSVITFALIRLAPGNPARLLLPQGATDAEVEALAESMGLKRPLVEQYLTYMRNVVKGDLGLSLSYKKPNLQLIGERLPATVVLTAAAVLVSLSISIPMGVMGGIKKGSFIDFLAMFFALLGQSMSPVWIGLVLILFFAVHLRWLPAMGYGNLKHVLLPAITLGTPMAALVTRMTRSGMIDVLSEDYITATRAKGVSQNAIVFKYALKNVMIPVVTVLGIQIGTFLGGAVVTEQIFQWPGIGGLTIAAINQRDFPLVQALMLVISFMFVMVNLAVDILYTFLDPRLKF